MSEKDPVPFDQAVWEVNNNAGRKAARRGFEPEHLSGYGDLLLMQLMMMPSFTSTVGWQIYQRSPILYRRRPIENDGKPRFLGCRTEWVQEEDLKRFSSPVTSLKHLSELAPTMRFQSVELDPEWLQSKQTELRSISIAPYVDSETFGLDGVRYEITQNGFKTHSCFNWWCDGPDEWRPLTKIVLAMLDELEGKIAAL